ncbi:MAG: hypothetical protein FWC45_02915 [Treponema sp.]|nr:hypothetical protein [Treponema sp.]
MDVLRPLRGALFFYEVFRLLLLVVFLFMAPLGVSESGTFFPYLVYLSANALFPLMALFVWLRIEEYKNYLPLYLAGKIIGVVSFYAWEFFSPRDFPGAENVVISMVLLGGSAFISLADILSVWGAWVLNNKCRPKPAESGGGFLPLEPQ